MVILQDSIVIHKDVETVRRAFLDFAAYSVWRSLFIQSIKVTTPNKAPDSPILSGDTLEVKIILPVSQKENIFDPVVLENSEQRFRWKGKLIFDSIFAGEHKFEFVSIENGTKTSFIQSQEFTGLLAWPLLKFIGEDTQKGFSLFNEKFKEHVENTSLSVD